uniref:guanylate kinase n=1 Tax=Syphacia muris TaxID=451379 RepID=A0A0N5AXR3_9BILA
MRPLVMSGPSGSGKSTIIQRTLHTYPDKFALSVSHTTRAPRVGEIDGVHYHFSDPETFQKMVENGEFLEYATFGGNLYGTSKKAVEDVQRKGKVCILDVELNGVRSIKKSDLDAVFVVVKPPDLETLTERLRNRKTETEDSLQKRLKHAVEDLKAISNEPTLFDYTIINDDLEKAYQQFLKVLSEEKELEK